LFHNLITESKAWDSDSQKSLFQLEPLLRPHTRIGEPVPTSSFLRIYSPLDF